MIARLFIKAGLACLLALAFSTAPGDAAEPIAETTAAPVVKPWKRWCPDYLCLCPGYCPKPCPPAPCGDLRTSCACYCKKQLPCPCIAPLRTTCDCYDCKPIPRCFPPSPCPRCCPRD
jgi:hypothetical protein